MKIGLILTFGMSLAKWDSIGILNRELEPYKRLSSLGIDTCVFSYGIPTTERQLGRIHGFEVVCLSPFTSRLDSLLLMFLESLFISIFLKNNSLCSLRTNQLFGFWIGSILSFRFSLPLVVRSGYEFHSFWRRTYSSIPRHTISFLLSFIAYRFSSLLEFTSHHDIRYVRRYFNPTCPIIYRPNWIDTNTFSPSSINKLYSSITVGRLSPQKNHMAILESIASKPRCTSLKPLLFVGKGPCRDSLIDFAFFHNIPLKIISSVPNESIVELLNMSHFYAHCSTFEGHPKALLEALSVGIPVLSIHNNRLKHLFGDSNCLTFSSSESFADFYTCLPSSAPGSPDISFNARSFIQTHYSLQNRVLTLCHDIVKLSRLFTT